MRNFYTLADYQQKLADKGLVNRFIKDEALLVAPVLCITFNSENVQTGTLLCAKARNFEKNI